MKKKWKVLLVCVVDLTGIAAWCLVPRPAVEEDFKIHYVRTGERLTDITGQVDLEALGGLLRNADRLGYHWGYDGRLEERYMLIMGVDRKGPVHILLDEGTFLVDRGDFLGMYPLVNGEELLEQVWALLPEP